ncbi:hypothetical protein CT0861_10555 [Colletotrichum tofieldiae]|uniref:Uncharacterized protein n=1 Tax=Colletotrichum tofieldiae TaxID=708197 RepID=A0A166VSW4_9PEZI|nr:hypothetical protein CT0861_10555 [Colletotrichum tofieldiae]
MAKTSAPLPRALHFPGWHHSRFSASPVAIARILPLLWIRSLSSFTGKTVPPRSRRNTTKNQSFTSHTTKFPKKRQISGLARWYVQFLASSRSSKNGSEHWTGFLSVTTPYEVPRTVRVRTKGMTSMLKDIYPGMKDTYRKSKCIEAV